jgi:hypothetical protein
MTRRNTLPKALSDSYPTAAAIASCFTARLSRIMLAARTIRHCVRCSRGVSPTSVRNRAANAERDIDTLRARVGTVHPCPGWKCMSRKASPQYNLQFPMGPVGRVWRCRTRHCPHNPKGRWFKSSPRNHVKAPGNQRVLGASWFSLEGGRRPFLSRLHSSLPSSPGGGAMALWPGNVPELQNVIERGDDPLRRLGAARREAHGSRHRTETPAEQRRPTEFWRDTNARTSSRPSGAADGGSPIVRGGGPLKSPGLMRSRAGPFDRKRHMACFLPEPTHQPGTHLREGAEEWRSSHRPS